MKKIQSLIVFIVAVAVVITVVEVAGYLMFADSAPVSGSMTITDEVGDTTSPEQPLTDILEVTVERNETHLTITMKVNGDIPNQTEYRVEGRIEYFFNNFVRLTLEGNEWVPEMGHAAYTKGGKIWYTEYAGEDFPGCFSIDHKNRTIRIALELNSLKDKDERYRAFRWFMYSGYEAGGLWRFTVDETESAYFPDYESFIRQSEQSSLRKSINTFYLSFLAPLFIGGVIVWGIGVQALPKPPKQVKILGVIYSFHGILFLATAINLLYMHAFAALAFLLFFVCVAFFLTVRGILRGKRLTRKSGFVLSTLTAVFGFLLFIVAVRGEIWWRSSPDYYTDWVGIFIVSVLFFLWATSVLCIYCLTRPKVKDFLARD